MKPDLSLPERGPARSLDAAAPASLRLAKREALSALAWALGIFLALGTLTALWANPLFMRMTPVDGWDYVLLGAEAALAGLYLGLRGGACAVKRAGIGGLLGFVGFGCVLCNQVLLFVFGASFLLANVEPYRHLAGAVGILLLAWAVQRKWRSRAGEQVGDGQAVRAASGLP
jgi:hypothetical protein